MSDDRIYTGTFDTSVAGATPGEPFGMRGAQHLAISTDVPATGSPEGSWTLEREEIAGWATYDADGDIIFAGPAGGAAAGTVNVRNPPPGRYRMVYTRTSGGGPGATVIARSVSY
jgi:hypothetical protein